VRRPRGKPTNSSGLRSAEGGRNGRRSAARPAVSPSGPSMRGGGCRAMGRARIVPAGCTSSSARRPPRHFGNLEQQCRARVGPCAGAERAEARRAAEPSSCGRAHLEDVRRRFCIPSAFTTAGGSESSRRGGRVRTADGVAAWRRRRRRIHWSAAADRRAVARSASATSKLRPSISLATASTRWRRGRKPQGAVEAGGRRRGETKGSGGRCRQGSP